MGAVVSVAGRFALPNTTRSRSGSRRAAEHEIVESVAIEVAALARWRYQAGGIDFDVRSAGNPCYVIEIDRPKQDVVGGNARYQQIVEAVTIQVAHRTALAQSFIAPAAEQRECIIDGNGRL